MQSAGTGRCRESSQTPSIRKENQQMKADPNTSRMERSLPQGKTHSWKQELGKEKGARNDEGLRPKLRQVVGSLQVMGH